MSEGKQDQGVCRDLPGRPDPVLPHRSVRAADGESEGKSMNKQRAFTLIELLVVIAIIAILMSVLAGAATSTQAGKDQCVPVPVTTMGALFRDVHR